MKKSAEILHLLKKTVAELEGPDLATVDKVVKIANGKRPDLGITPSMASIYLSKNGQNLSGNEHLDMPTETGRILVKHLGLTPNSDRLIQLFLILISTHCR
jgi:hypothetical protein